MMRTCRGFSHRVRHYSPVLFSPSYLTLLSLVVLFLGPQPPTSRRRSDGSRVDTLTVGGLGLALAASVVRISLRYRDGFVVHTDSYFVYNCMHTCKLVL